MAEKLPEHEFTNPRNPMGRPEKYPWEEWTDGSVWKVTHGEDFDCSMDGFRSSLTYYAKRNNLKVKTQIPIGDPKSVVFQFSKNGK